MKVELGIPRLTSRDVNVTITPDIIDAKWSKNSYLEADALTITFSWLDGGVDPRWLRNAVAFFWMWDEHREEFNEQKHLRFKGVCVKASRKVSGESMTVDMTFHDYTTFFIHMKPFPNAGMPEYSDTLQDIWKKICDNTGPYIPATKKIDSSVVALRDNLVFADSLLQSRPELLSETLGQLVPGRFHDIAKPTPKNRTDAWAVWNWCLTSLGLISYIDKEECIVIDGPSFFDESNAPSLLYGDNILEFDESVDSDISLKGVVVQSFNPLTGQTLEAFYPDPSDERIRVAKAKAKRAGKEAREVSANDTSAEWIPYSGNGITDPAALERLAELIYDQQHRQQIEGTLKTSDMTLFDREGRPVDILSLNSGDAIVVGIAKYDRESLLTLSPGDRADFLVSQQGYLPEIASLIANNIELDNFNSQLFHVMSLEVELSADKFEVEVKYQSTFHFTDDLKDNPLPSTVSV